MKDMIDFKKKKFLIIDTSYVIFYKIFSTQHWYRLANPDDKFEMNYNWNEKCSF